MAKLLSFVGLILSIIILMPIVACGTSQRLMAPIIETAIPSSIIRVPVDKHNKIVVLTIDDAPSARTEEILDVLAHHQVRATFFIHTDQINSPSTQMAMQRIVEGGHDIAHHMPTDKSYSGYTSASFLEEFQRADEVLRGYKSSFRPYFRPPQGAFSPHKMDHALVTGGYDRPLKGSNRRYVLASFIPWDAAKGKTDTQDMVRSAKNSDHYTDQLVSNLYPGAIVIFHDGMPPGREPRVEATITSLDRFLRESKAKGYSILPLSEAIALSE